MSDDLRISIVVVSFGRPAALRRCLRGLSQLRHQRFEIIVVADPEGLAVAQTEPFADRLCLLPQDAPNISIARNIGIAAATGDIVAFIDDDAVPEPTWATRIAKAFDHPSTNAVTGLVRGRNGISVQWARMSVDREGRDRRLDAQEGLRSGEALKLHGTNMAFRREVLVKLGGFDPAFAFYLDDTDLALRLSVAGHEAAYLEDAVVHHGFAASARRTADRVPLTLYDIGASTRAFLSKHTPDADHPAIFKSLEADQRSRLLRLARKRKLDPAQMRGLMESLHAGWEDGASFETGMVAHTPTERPFHVFRSGDMPPMRVLAGRPWQSAQLRRQAAELVKTGVPVSLFLLEPTPRKHSVTFTDQGWWEHRGGLFGPSDRSAARFQLWSFRGRLKKECDRIASERGILM